MPDEAADGGDGAAAGSTPYFEAPVAGSSADASATVVHMDDYPAYEIAAGVFFRPVFAQNAALNFVTFPAHSGFPEHTHPEEQISIVREGEMELTVDGVTHRVGPGDVIVLPPDVRHSGRTFEGPCRIIDIFSPPRTGLLEVIGDADPQRSADVDRWWVRTEPT